MTILSTENLITLIDAGAISANDIMGTKGIVNVSDWDNAYPVTFGQLIKRLLSKMPEMYWLVSIPDSDELVEKHAHFDSAAYEDIEAECREPQAMKPFETDAKAAPEDEQAAVVADEEPEPAAVAADEEPAPAAVDVGEEPAPAAVDVDEEPDQAAAVTDEGPYLVAATLPERFKPVEVVIEKEPQEATASKTRTKKPRSEADFSPASGLGEWSKYKERALSTSEQNDIIKGMLDDGYSVAVISTVTRLSQATVYNRIKKLGIVLTNKGAE